MNSALFALLLATPASAADLSARIYAKAPAVDPAYNWTGFYAGVHAGVLQSDNTDQLSPSPFTPGLVTTSAPLNGPGFIGGAQIGANYQVDRLVLGIETDISYVTLDASGSTHGTGAVATSGHTKIEMFGTLRGRAGFAASDHLLIYGTGGLAYADAKFASGIVPDPAFSCITTICYAGENSKFKTGWVAGGGVEYAMFSNWTVKAEYLHFDLGEISNVMPAIPGPSLPFTSSTKLTGDIVRAGVNYKFAAAP